MSKVTIESNVYKDINTLVPFSVSYQFLYICISYYYPRCGVNIYPTAHNCQEERQSKQEGRQETVNYPMIGLDIVTFDEHNKRLYATVDMFQKVTFCCVQHRTLPHGVF